MITKQIKLEYCEVCGRLNVDIYDLVFNIDKVYDNKFISDYGIQKYENWNCFHCSKKVYFFRRIDLFSDFELYKWKIYFYKFNKKLFQDYINLVSNLNKLNCDSLYVLDFSKYKMNLVLRKNYNKINIISFIELIDEFEDSYEFVIQVYGPINLIPNIIAVKDLFILKVFFNEEKKVKKIEIFEFEMKFMWFIAFRCLFFWIEGYDEEEEIDYLDVRNLI